MRKNTVLVLTLSVGILSGVQLSACSSASSFCNASTCSTGCCDASGKCQAGTLEASCGSAGAACSVCSASQRCLVNACTTATASGGGSSVGGGSETGGGNAVGGGNATGGGSTTLPDGGTGPTWYKDVLAVTQVHCAGCHNPTGIGGFSLETWAAAKPMASAMASAATERRMPPWQPAEGCGGDFVGKRRLTQAEINTIVDWSISGAKEGNVADAPAPVDHTGEQLPRTDKAMQMDTAYTPVVSNRDDYRCFLMDPATTTAKSLTGFEITPGAKAQVHHVILYLVNKTDAVAKDAAEAGAGWQCFGDPAVPTDGALGAWAPGSPAVIFPAGTGIEIAPGKAIAMQIHYNTAAGTAPDQTSIKLMYATGTVTGAYMIPLVADGFRIPPNSTGYTYTQDFPNQFGFGIKVWGLLPHMHTKGTHIKMEAPLGNNCLVDIPKWDFHWQQSYFRPTPFSLANGASIKMTCTWDNPTSSEIQWGENTSNEMCFAYVYATL